MEKHLAKQFADAALSLGVKLNKLHALSELITDGPSKQQFRLHIGEAMAIMNCDILMPVVKLYPELDPDKSADHE
jgi:hypothetical protein